MSSTSAPGKAKTLTLKLGRDGKFEIPTNMLGKLAIQTPVGFSTTGLSVVIVGMPSGNTIVGLSDKDPKLSPIADLEKLYAAKRVVNREDVLDKRTAHLDAVKQVCMKLAVGNSTLDPVPNFSTEFLKIFQYQENLENSVETIQRNFSRQSWNDAVGNWLVAQANLLARAIGAFATTLLTDRRNKKSIKDFVENHQALWWSFLKLAEKPLVIQDQTPLVQVLFPKDLSKGISVTSKEADWIADNPLFWRNKLLFGVIASDTLRARFLNYQEVADPSLQKKEEERCNSFRWTLMSPINQAEILRDRYDYKISHNTNTEYASVFCQQLIKLACLKPPLGTPELWWTTYVHKDLGGIPANERVQWIIDHDDDTNEECVDYKRSKIENFGKPKGYVSFIGLIHPRLFQGMGIEIADRPAIPEDRKVDPEAIPILGKLTPAEASDGKVVALKDSRIFATLKPVVKKTKGFAIGILNRDSKKFLKKFTEDPPLHDAMKQYLRSFTIPKMQDLGLHQLKIELESLGKVISDENSDSESDEEDL